MAEERVYTITDCIEKAMQEVKENNEFAKVERVLTHGLVIEVVLETTEEENCYDDSIYESYVYPIKDGITKEEVTGKLHEVANNLEYDIKGNVVSKQSAKIKLKREINVYIRAGLITEQESIKVREEFKSRVRDIWVNEV